MPHFTLTSDTPWKTTFCDASGQVVYKTESHRVFLGPRKMNITRLLPHPTTIAEIDYRYTSNSKIRYGGQETKSDKFFRKEGWSWNGRGRLFTGPDGQEYVWKMKDENCVVSAHNLHLLNGKLSSLICYKLYWKGNKETPAATYHPPKSGLFRKGRPGSLEIRSEVMYMCDLVVMTFIYIEKFRQDRLEENDFIDDAIENSAGE
ncbi:unnamed protein product [Cyclocybe aegerita]|uniref:DUF6593 domain-containing protein n=1 Tax=Cyclocybe aegerita TaxID=1973307 RepID=A0A8S0W869_CYCAE|nr:unnamed protein product [Cyclocybe aegerita]